MKKQLSPIQFLYIGRALEGAAYASLTPFLVLHFMKTLGLTAISSGLVMGIKETIPIFTAIGMGWLIANTNRKAALVISLLSLSLTAFIFKTGLAGISGLFIAAVLSGLAYSSMRIAFASSMADLIEKEKSAQGFASLHAAANTGYAIGPLFSGYWVAIENYENAFLVSIALYIISALIIYIGLPSSSNEKKASKSPSLKEISSQLGPTGLLFFATLLFIVFINGINVQMHLFGLAKHFVDYFRSTKATPIFWTIQSAAVVFLVPLSGRLMKGWSIKSLFTSYIAGSLINAAAYSSLGFFNSEHLILGFICVTIFSLLGECLWAPCMGAIYMELFGKRQIGVIFGLSQTILALGFAAGSNIGGFALEKALALEFLPHYWRILGLICLPFLTLLTFIGFLSLENYLKEQKKVLVQSLKVEPVI